MNEIPDDKVSCNSGAESAWRIAEKNHEEWPLC